MGSSKSKNSLLTDEILIALNKNPGVDLKRLLTDAVNYKYPGRTVYSSSESKWQENWTPNNDDLYNALKAYNNRR